jgi:radical SAM superfamily enzyme YgiQ (UPF0313 family)
MDKLDILFIIPPFYRLLGSHHNSVNLGVLYLATVLDRAGYKAKVYNADHEDNGTYATQKQIFDNWGAFSKNLKNENYFDGVRQVILNHDVEYIGLTITSSTIIQALKIATIAKKIDRKIKIIVGGPHVTLNQDMVEEYKIIGLFDYYFTGQSEAKLLDFFNGQYVQDRPDINIDDLPFPDYSLVLNNQEYINRSSVITARGCPFNCVYCASHQLWGGKVKYRSVENIVEEIKQLDVDFIDFVDDTFTFNKNRCMRLMNELKKLNVKWECDTRIDKLTPELLSAMKESGCVKIKLGIESGSQKILDWMNKKIDLDMIRKVTGWVKDSGIKWSAYYMIGLPGETDKDVIDTINLAKEIQADYNSLSIYTPYKRVNTHLYHQNMGLLKDNGISGEVVSRFLYLAT